MAGVKKLESYRDENGNEIVCEGPVGNDVWIFFRGSNNRLVISTGAKIAKLNIQFDCDNGTVSIGTNNGAPAFSAYMRVGQDSTITIGDNVSVTNAPAVIAVEGQSVTIGDDVMIASENDIRVDDAHPIFDVVTGKRVNVSKSIKIGNHVWIGKRAAIFGGSVIGDGSVVGYGSVVKGKVPNNCVVAGAPARVVRRNVAWERPHLSLTKPFYKPDASTVKKSAYWALTEDDASASAPAPASMRRRVRRLLRAVAAQLRK